MEDLDTLLTARFGDPGSTPDIEAPEVWNSLARRGSVREFTHAPVPPALIARLGRLALCAPSKSDLQQRDIVHVVSSDQRQKILALVADQHWTQDIPELLIFCGNNHRQRLVHDMRGHPFANDHADALFNAAVDAGIALSAFVIAAEAVGLGCCPISAVRNHPNELTELLDLPQHVFPVAGLALGWPVSPAGITPRLPLGATTHIDVFDNEETAEHVAEYDSRRNETKPYVSQRNPDRFGTHDEYGWSEDKARQYAEPERADFGAYLRNQGFKLD